jgi:stage II sporulation protein M
MGNFRKNYKELIGYLKEAINFIFFSVIVFNVGILIGFSYPERFNGFLESFYELSEYLKGQNVYFLVLFIFIRNSFSAALSIGLGFLLGIIPLIGAVTNGILFGTLISLLIGAGNAWALLTLLPHGIFELPAVFFAWGLGLWRGAWFFQKVKDQSFREREVIAFRIYFRIILPLLIIAAIIEGLGIVSDRVSLN